MIEALRHRIVTVTVILRFDRAARKEIEFNGVFIVLCCNRPFDFGDLLEIYCSIKLFTKVINCSPD
jgi:hypothetical protein